ncbi:hypothetical protein ACFC0D_03420 [Streptomyces sp. NPDC056222]|uniref:hypothetical protein n=1 Tax=Streptomyces sp. NPDC056222 TaxID=3345749 RepID=UPI0035DB5549
MKLSKSQGRGNQLRLGRSAAGIFGAITGSVGGFVAAGGYTYVATFGAEGVAEC